MDYFIRQDVLMKIYWDQIEHAVYGDGADHVDLDVLEEKKFELLIPGGKQTLVDLLEGCREKLKSKELTFKEGQFRAGVLANKIWSKKVGQGLAPFIKHVESRVDSWGELSLD